MKHVITYDLAVELWRGDHAQNEIIPLTIRSQHAAWSEKWIDQIVNRIWDLTNYSTLQIRTALRLISITEIRIDYDEYAV